MAAKKITMQDIADACGLSRNTVSKVLMTGATCRKVHVKWF